MRADRSHGVGKDHVGHGNLLGIENELRDGFIVQNAVLVGIIGVARIYDDTGKIVTTAEHAHDVEHTDGSRQLHPGERRALAEYIFAELDIAAAAGKRYRRKICTVLESIRTERFNRGGNGELRQHCTGGKRIIPDFCHAAVFLEFHRRQCFAVIERSVADRLAVALNHRALEDNLLKIHTVGKRIHSDGLDIRIEGDRSELIAIHKRFIRDRRDPGGNGIISAPIDRAVNNCLARRVAEQSVHRRIVGIPLFHFDVRKRSTAIERFIDRGKFPDALGQRNRLERRAFLERKILDRQNIRRVVRKGAFKDHFFQLTASVECRLTDITHRGGNGNRCDIRTGEGTDGNFLHAGGNAVHTGPRRGEISDTHQTGARIVIDQNPFHRGIMYVVIAFDGIDIDIHEVGAPRKCARRIRGRNRTDQLDRIGNINAHQRRAIQECAAVNGRNRQIVIRCRNTDRTEFVDLRSLLHRIGSRPVCRERLDKTEHFAPAGIYGRTVLRNRPGRNTVPLGIGITDTSPVRLRIIALERPFSVAFVAVFGHRQRIVFAVNDRGRLRRGRAAVRIQRYAVRLRSPISIKSNIVPLRKESVFIFSAAARRAARHIVPARENIAASRDVFGKSGGIAVRFVKASRPRAAAGVQRDFIGVDAGLHPCGNGIDAVSETDAKSIPARLRQSDRRRILIAVHADDLAVIHLNFVISCAPYAVPGQHALIISDRFGHGEIAHADFIAPQRVFRAVRADADDIVVHAGPAVEIRAQIKAVGVGGVFRPVDFHRIRTCARNRVPDDLVPGGTHVVRRAEHGLLIRPLGRDGRIPALRLRIDVDDDFAGSAFLDAVTGAVADVDFAMVVRSVAARNGNDIAHGIRHRIPVQSLRRFVKFKAVDRRELAIVNELSRNRRTPAVRLRGDRETDPAFLHRTAREIIIGGIAERNHGMAVVVVSAVNRKIIALCVLHAFKYERGRLHHRNVGNARKRFVAVIAGRRGGGIIRHRIGRRSLHGDDIISLRLRRKIKRIAQRIRHRLIDDHFPSGILHADGIDDCAADGRPADRVRVDADQRRRGYRIVLRPDGVKGRIFRKLHPAFVTIGQFFPVVIRAHPPAFKSVPVAIGLGQHIHARVDGLHRRGRFRVIPEIEVHRKFARSDFILTPVRVQSHVGRDGL